MNIRKNLKILLGVSSLLIFAAGLSGCNTGGSSSDPMAASDPEGEGPIRITIAYQEKETKHTGTVVCSWKDIEGFLNKERTLQRKNYNNEVVYSAVKKNREILFGSDYEDCWGDYRSAAPLSFENIPGYDAQDRRQYGTTIHVPSYYADISNLWKNEPEQAAICDASYRELYDLWNNSIWPVNGNYEDKKRSWRPETGILIFPLYGWERLSTDILYTKTFRFPYYNLPEPERRSYQWTVEFDDSFSLDIRQETRRKWWRQIENITIELIGYSDNTIVSCSGEGIYGNLSIEPNGRKAIFTWTYGDNPVDTYDGIKFLLEDGKYFQVMLNGSIPQ